MVRKEIKKLVEKAIENLYKEEVAASIGRPQGLAFGDYSTNAAMVLEKDPEEIASAIKSDMFEKIEVKNGFINFFISKEHLQQQVKDILKQKEKFGSINLGKNNKVNIEYCSANPTGPLHLGHGRGAFWGDCLSNILQKAGFKTTKEYFVNDYGRQIILLGRSIDARYREIFGESVEMEEGFYKGEYVKDLAQSISKKDGDKYLKISETARIKAFSEMGLGLILNETKELLGRIGTKYDVWFSEKTLYKKGLVKKAVGLLEKKGFVYEKEGALWFSSTKFGDDKDRVLTKADGEPTYFSSDIAYHLNKLSRGYDLLIDGWGADHWGYKPRLMAAAKVFGFDQKLKIVVGQFVRLVEGNQEVKMSKRGGTFFALRDLIGQVGADVARFFFLMKSVDTHIDFDLNLAKQQSEKNPVYYVQYAHARICSILNNAKYAKADPKKVKLEQESELGLAKQLIRLPEIIEDTAEDYQVQRIPQYAVDLATAFHRFYRDCRVISEDKEVTESRIALVSAVKIVLKNTLDLMGVSAPEKM